MEFNETETIVADQIETGQVDTFEEDQRDNTAANAEIFNSSLDITDKDEVNENVSNYLKELWTDAEEAKKPIEKELLKSLSQRDGKYDPEVLSLLEKEGGSQNYHGLTGEKCRICETLIRDVLLETDSIYYDILPTPNSEVSIMHQDEINEQADRLATDVMNMLSPEELQKPNVIAAIQRASEIMVSQRKKRIVSKDVKKIKKTIDDQLIEGNAIKAMAEFISDFATYSSACIYGPTIQSKKKLIWKNGKAEEKEEVFFSLERIRPFDIFPEPGISDIQNGYVFLRREVSRKDIEQLRFSLGYNIDQIEKALEDKDEFHSPNDITSDAFSTDDSSKSEQKKLENRDDTSSVKDKKLYLITYWGTLSGAQLKELGVKNKTKGEEFDDLKEYDIWCEIVNDIVIKCELNPNPLGKKPIHMSGAYKIPGALWHDSLAKVIRPYQRTCNTALRGLQNNISFSSRPITELNQDKLPSGLDISEIVPGMFIPTATEYDNSDTSNALKFHTIPTNSSETMNVLREQLTFADNACGIPRLAYGGNTIGTGAGRTASGMSMMLSSSSKTIKQMIKNIDFDITKPIIEMMYNLNLLYNDKFEGQGDITIIPLGSTEVVSKEADINSLLEFYRIVSSNPVNMQILGEDGYRELFNEISQHLKISDTITPDDSIVELKKIINGLSVPVTQQQVQPGQQQGGQSSAGQQTPQAPPSQPNGSPKGGQIA